MKSVMFITTLIMPVTLTAGSEQDAKALRTSILALDSARKTAVEELRTLPLSKNEISDYKDFIVFLNTRIANYCLELADPQHIQTLQELPCPSVYGTMVTEEASTPTEDITAYSGSPEAPPSRTRAEISEDLDDALLSALGKFDEMLLKEEEKVAERFPSQREVANGGGASGTSRDKGSEKQAGGTETEGDPSATSSDGASREGSETPDSSSSAQAGAGQGTSTTEHAPYGVPGGTLPPPEDDDIVARQLREAAEKETDPELKKKLWEEYWKYKGVKKGS